jgi:hypothetical protein
MKTVFRNIERFLAFFTFKFSKSIHCPGKIGFLEQKLFLCTFYKGVHFLNKYKITNLYTLFKEKKFHLMKESMCK